MPGFEAERPTFADILSLHARWRGDKPALIVGDEVLSWAAFDAATNKVAHGLARLGLGPGDRIAVVMRNGRAMVEVLFGIMKAGGCSVPLNLSISDDALCAMLADCGSAALFASDDQAARIDAMAGRLPATLHGKRFVADAKRNGWQSYEAWTAGAPASLPAVAIDPNAACNVIYSSGTTGRPKGIVHSHRGRLEWAYDCALAFRYDDDARSLCTIGLYSNIMWLAMLCTLLVGGTLVVHDRFDAVRVLDDIARLRISHIAMVPLQFQRLADAGATRCGLASLRSAITVGSKMHGDIKRRMLALLPDALFELYGLTEGIITMQSPREGQLYPDSVGRPILGCDIVIIGENDKPVARGEAGEIVSRARYVMSGYLNRPEETAAARWRDPAGRIWLRTGDIGRLDAHMNLYIIDRRKDMILSGGQNIYPQDIEQVLLTHEAVRDAAVIGVASRHWGETPLALVVIDPAHAITAAQLKDWCNARVGKQQRVADVIVRDALPRNANGKLLKHELRQAYAKLVYD
ncbi:MAG: long-chain fatty acid--CoA ligase [Alphaproteobacteria bacterium]|nr:MAG: long-chain fatty acid--CoA ligase [Alphaproteobacteria bacterium]